MVDFTALLNDDWPNSYKTKSTKTMTNGAYHRLLNEWYMNKYNDSAVEHAQSLGIDDYDAYFISTDKMCEVRSWCKKNTIWLKDGDEEDLFFEYGGLKGKYKEVKKIIKEFHEYEKENGNHSARLAYLY